MNKNLLNYKFINSNNINNSNELSYIFKDNYINNDKTSRIF